MAAGGGESSIVVDGAVLERLLGVGMVGVGLHRTGFRDTGVCYVTSPLLFVNWLQTVSGIGLQN